LGLSPSQWQNIVQNNGKLISSNLDSPTPGGSSCGYRKMDIYAPGIEPEREREDRLKVARTLYNILVAKHLDRLITLCDDDGRVMARSDRSDTMSSGNLTS
jgi:hypothetical protein